MAVQNSVISCGVKLVLDFHGGYYTPGTQKYLDRKPFESVLTDFEDFAGGIYLFSDHVDFNGKTSAEAIAHQTHRGPEFAKWLVENDLGEVHALPDTINPNTGHTIRVWGWYPNRAKVFEKLATFRKTEEAEIRKAKNAQKAAVAKTIEHMTLADLVVLVRTPTTDRTTTVETPKTLKRRRTGSFYQTLNTATRYSADPY
jgi:hypothetical protein